MVDERLADAKEHGWREVAAVEAAHARGELDDAGWHAAMAALIVPSYLAAPTASGGSGHSGTPEAWEYSRGIVAEALVRDGTFLDVGCANGLLVESMARWGAERGLSVEPHGLDIAPELAALARRRLPQWADRIHVGNALGWRPPQRYDVVRVCVDYVPSSRRRELVAWLIDEVVAPGGRLVLGKINEEVARRSLEEDLVRWGFSVAGRADRPHRAEPRLAYRVVWIDVPVVSVDFRALRREDLPDIARWLRAKHVDAWWHEGAGVEERWLPRIEGREPTHVHMLLHGGRSIGWLQWYRWRDYPAHAARLGAGADDVGLDLAVGEEDLLGRGMGAAALAAFVELLFADPTVSACICDPAARNLPSLRTFARAGFTDIGVYLDSDGTERRMVRRNRSSSR